MACTRRKMKRITANSLVDPPSHFFKVILPTTLAEKKLGIPQRFVKMFGDGLSAVAHLKVPNGCVWQVGLMKDGRKFWFQDGWHDFVKYHSICAGYFLVFGYEKNSTFQVLIFDMTACEIYYPPNSEKPEKQNSVHHDEIENKPQSNLENSNFQPQKKRCKMEEIKWVNKANYENSFEFLASIEEMGIYICRNHRALSKEQKERAINIAKLLQPENPSFMIIIRSRNIRECGVYVPAKFFNKYTSRDARYIGLQVSDGKRQWPVQLCCIHKGGFRLTRGWSRFTKEKNLKEGDICVFELIRIKGMILKVAVYCATMKLT